MSYRDDRQALALQLAELERENERLRSEIESFEERLSRVMNERQELQHARSRRSCVLCRGTLLPVAIFAGHDTRAPLPLSMSTLRFVSPQGGFTHSAPVRSFVCSTCGFIHNFVDITAPASAGPGPGE
ncbi:MAG: hypothetical protein KC420_02810 [Myxococcales bacterium]|nr:hypothetical protein [Myxococcales bacterium]